MTELQNRKPAAGLWKLLHLWKSNIEGYALLLDDFHKMLGKHKTLSTVTTASATALNKHFSILEKPIDFPSIFGKSLQWMGRGSRVARKNRLFVQSH